MADEAYSPNNVVAVSFEDDANTYEAMTKLKELDSQRQVDLRAAAIIVRHEDLRRPAADVEAEMTTTTPNRCLPRSRVTRGRRSS